MKNQYVGDIGDYGKYGLLRFLASRGIRIGVNWYLTDNDETKDGKFTNYLKDADIMGDMQYDKDLFYLLQPIVEKGKSNKCVQDIEKAGIIPKAVFFHEMLPKSNTPNRCDWHNRAMDALSITDVDLIFADPDNGTFRDKKKLPIRSSEKYAMLEELREFYDAGKNVVYYCHKARRKQEAWAEKKHEFNDEKHHAKIIVLTFHRGTQRSYFFAIHPEDYDKYDDIVNDFLKSAWGSVSIGRKEPPFSREK